MNTQYYNYLLQELRAGKQVKFVFIGDSITSAEWVNPNWRALFEYILKFSFSEYFTGDTWWIPEWNLKFYNYALDGATTKEFLSQTRAALTEVSPQFVFVLGTSNDMELGITVKEHEENLATLFRLLGKNVEYFAYSPDIVSNDQELNNKYLPYRRVAEGIEKPANCITVDGYAITQHCPFSRFFTLVKSPFEYTEEEKVLVNQGKAIVDLIHPNVLGNVYIAKMYLEAVFGVAVDAEKLFTELRNDTKKYPQWL